MWLAGKPSTDVNTPPTTSSGACSPPAPSGSQVTVAATNRPPSIPLGAVSIGPATQRSHPPACARGVAQRHSRAPERLDNITCENRDLTIFAALLENSD